MMKTSLLLVASVGVVCGLQPEYYESLQFLVEADQQSFYTANFVGAGRAAEALNAALAARHIDALKSPVYRSLSEDGVPKTVIDEKAEKGYKHMLFAEASCMANMNNEVDKNVTSARRVAGSAEVMVCGPIEDFDRSTDHRLYWLGVLKGITDTTERLVAMDRNNANTIKLLNLAAGRAKNAFKYLLEFIESNNEYTKFVKDRADVFRTKSLQQWNPVNSTKRRSDVWKQLPEDISSNLDRRQPHPASGPLNSKTQNSSSRVKHNMYHRQVL